MAASRTAGEGGRTAQAGCILGALFGILSHHERPGVQTLSEPPRNPVVGSGVAFSPMLNLSGVC